MTILIGLPAYPGFIKTDCALSLMAAQAALLAKGIKVDVAKNQPADIVLARNILASMVLQTERFTHLLFVDNDMQFDPQTVLRLIEFDNRWPGASTAGRNRNPITSFVFPRVFLLPALAHTMQRDHLGAG